MILSLTALAMGLATTMTNDIACQGLERLDFKVSVIYLMDLLSRYLLTTRTREFLIPLLRPGSKTQRNSKWELIF